ncbi:MAG: DUF2382 domain-containing protein [Leptolyngbyaceae cyanobacterium RM2_2_4]|nr:DUF2382 domain-containing protein [Leptolyngbyaceae cyanobacterium RM2_2_4]
MALYKLEDFYPNYRGELFGGEDIKGLNIYTEQDEKVGTVSTALVDNDGRFRYLVMDTGFWIFGKKVLLPVGRFRSDPRSQRIYLKGLSRHQAEQLPEYDEHMTVDYDYEERVRGVYRTAPLENGVPLEGLPLETRTTAAPVRRPEEPERGSNIPPAQPVVLPINNPTASTDFDRTGRGANRDRTPYNRSTYQYEQEPSLYAMNEQDHQTFRLYEEQLVAHKDRRKVGEVTIGKHIETETTQVAVPVQQERVVIQHSPTANRGTAVTPGTNDFQSGEVMRVDLYEETVDITKQPVVRDEVVIRKEVQQGTVTAEETLRREELDIDTAGRPLIDERPL